MSRSNPIHYRSVIETMIYLGYSVYDSDHPVDNQLTTKADYVAHKLSEAPSTPMLVSQIAEAWKTYEEAQQRAAHMLPQDVSLCRDWDCPTRHSCARFLITNQVVVHNPKLLTIYSIADSCRAEFTKEELQDGCPAYIEVPMPI